MQKWDKKSTFVFHTFDFQVNLSRGIKNKKMSFDIFFVPIGFVGMTGFERRSRSGAPLKNIYFLPRNYFYIPSKPPFKFTSLLFVATARKNKFICSSLALIATLIREASLGAENEIRCERPRNSHFMGRGCKYSSREQE